MPANPCPIRLCEESFLRALRASVGARTPFGHLSTLPRCIAPIRAPSGLSGGLSTLERVAGRARRAVLGVPTMRTSAQAPLRRSQSPAGVAGAWTHPNDYLRPHTGSQWALRGRWHPVLGRGHGLLRGHWGGLGRRAGRSRRGHGSAGGAGSRRVRIRHGASPQDSVRTLASPHTAGGRRRGARGGRTRTGVYGVCCVGVCVCFIVHDSGVTESANNQTIAHEPATTESEPATPNPQETKQSLANPHSTEPTAGLQAERWWSAGHYRNFCRHWARLKKTRSVFQ